MGFNNGKLVTLEIAEEISKAHKKENTARKTAELRLKMFEYEMKLFVEHLKQRARECKNVKRRLLLEGEAKSLDAHIIASKEKINKIEWLEVS